MIFTKEMVFAGESELAECEALQLSSATTVRRVFQAILKTAPPSHVFSEKGEPIFIALITGVNA